MDGRSLGRRRSRGRLAARARRGGAGRRDSSEWLRPCGAGLGPSDARGGAFLRAVVVGGGEGGTGASLVGTLSCRGRAGLAKREHGGRPVRGDARGARTA